MAPLILSAGHNHHWSDCTRLVEEHACQELWCSMTGSKDHCDRMLNHGLLDGTPCGKKKLDPTPYFRYKCGIFSVDIGSPKFAGRP
ncbi:unnamed protein product [Trichobilharzia regenti]|nr:unnamed protein product [Trichobilharzia regenti]